MFSIWKTRAALAAEALALRFCGSVFGEEYLIATAADLLRKAHITIRYRNIPLAVAVREAPR